MTTACIELVCAVGKLAYDEGEAWRLNHPELMEAYNTACKQLKYECGLEVKNNDTDTDKNETRQ